MTPGGEERAEFPRPFPTPPHIGIASTLHPERERDAS